MSLLCGTSIVFESVFLSCKLPVKTCSCFLHGHSGFLLLNSWIRIFCSVTAHLHPSALFWQNLCACVHACACVCVRERAPSQPQHSFLLLHLSPFPGERPSRLCGIPCGLTWLRVAPWTCSSFLLKPSQWLRLRKGIFSEKALIWDFLSSAVAERCLSNLVRASF